jgi:hypothetical protein
MRKLLVHSPLYATWILLLGALVLALVERQWHTAAMAILTILLTFVPIVFQRWYNVYIPPVLVSFVAFFAYATIFLGEVSGFYQKFWWWDLVLHLGSAIGFGLVGVIVLLLLFGRKRNESHPFIFALLSFCFAVSVGVLWEIYEFGMDQFFGFNMQKSGLFDTMADLIIDCIGASIASLAGYLYVIEYEKNPFRDLIERGYLGNKFLSKRANKEEQKEEKDEKSTDSE